MHLRTSALVLVLIRLRRLCLSSDVTFGDLDVGCADAGLADFDQSIAGIGRGLGTTRVEGEGLVEDERSHEKAPNLKHQNPNKFKISK